MLLYPSIDPVQRESTMDGDHVVYLLSMLPGELMDLMLFEIIIMKKEIGWKYFEPSRINTNT